MSHAKIGRFSKKQIFELPDGTHRLEPHLYVRVRGNGRYRNYFFRYLDPKGRVCDLALGSASKKPLSEVKQFAFLLKTSLQFSGKASALMEAKQHPVLFKDYARRVIEILASVRLWKNPAQKQSWSSSISTYAFPVIGEKFIDEIDRKDILKRKFSLMRSMKTYLSGTTQLPGKETSTYFFLPQINAIQPSISNLFPLRN